MNKTLHVALREFLATVLTKAFLLGIILPPAMMGMVIALMPILMNQKPPRTEGRVAVIDQSGLVAPLLDAEFTPEKLGEASREQLKKGQEMAKELAPHAQSGPMNMAMEQAVRTDASLTLEKLAAEAKVDEEKARVSTTRRRDELTGPDTRLVLAVIPPGAVRAAAAKPAEPTDPAKPDPAQPDPAKPDPAKPDPAKPDSAQPASAQSDPAQSFESFELYAAPTLDIEMKRQIENAIERAIVNARFKVEGWNAQRVRDLMATPPSKVVTLTDQGERKSNDVAAMMIPAGFMFLIWIAVFSSGQSLLTSTIEEKSSRVMEVLLSAASPVQIMVGKIIGQMGVGLLMLGVYGGAGVAALVAFAYAHLVDPVNIIYFAIYFIIAFMLIACMMSAIGSAVSELREAQTLMGPIMLVLVIPMILWLPILRNPNSTFAQIVSFLPPVSPFVMVLRIAGSEPVPFWQIPATMVLGLASVVVAAWAAAKIFRIGVLMYGKPPSFRTLLTWVRMA